MPWRRIGEWRHISTIPDSTLGGEPCIGSRPASRSTELARHATNSFRLLVRALACSFDVFPSSLPFLHAFSVGRPRLGVGRRVCRLRVWLQAGLDDRFGQLNFGLVLGVGWDFDRDVFGCLNWDYCDFLCMCSVSESEYFMWCAIW
jgi:hypothetical protein